MSTPIHSTITGLHIYPVKSCRGISLPEAELTARGLAYDREWMVVDAEDRFLTQRALPRMALIETAFTTDVLRLSAPGLSNRLDVPLLTHNLTRCRVRVWRDDCDALDEGPAAAAWLSDFLGTPARLVRFDPAQRRLSNHEWTRGADAENRFSDGYPVLVVSEESLDDLNRRLDVPLPMNRFRPNIVIRGIGPHGEDGLHSLSADDFEIRLVKPCERCRITTTDQATAEVGVEPLQSLAAYRRDERLNGVTFGMNGIVTTGAGAWLTAGMKVTARMAIHQLEEGADQRSAADSSAS